MHGLLGNSMDVTNGRDSWVKKLKEELENIGLDICGRANL
jgi:hypothetical protein